ncbi:MAG: DAK2 domain-containing protein [Erysipelothrix sp.]|nr:DAK2 domain-containing protein [Erysipelothrix sp.]
MDKITGDIFLKMLDNGANNLSNQHHEINALNVFPVPDGDTGTNMNLTFTNGLKEARELVSSHVGELSKKLSRGLLMGARGNSGVILSQIFRGFSQSVESKKELDANDLADAFQNATVAAYKAVMRPVEGTILTVLRESAQYAYDWKQVNEATPLEYLEYLVEKAKESLDYTPELLPVLKEVGVVDSGGAGYLAVLEGFVAALKGETIEALDISAEQHNAGQDMEHDEFGYCTEFIIQLDPKAKYSENKFKDDLEKLGNSIVVVTDEDLVKVHVHTLKPGNALNLGQKYGEFLKLKIENMSEQHHSLMESDIGHASKAKKEHSKYAIISVVAGKGIAKLFNELRCEYIISGGQTMNPSTEDFIELINEIDADHILILPNNSNIILAANQAKDILEDKDIHVVATKSIPQGLSACIMFNPDASIEENIEEMMDAVSNTTTAEITYAIKDTVFESVEIKKDDFMGIVEKDIVIANPSRKVVLEAVLKSLITDDKEIVTVLVGEDVSDDEMAEVESYINDNFEVEADVYRGDQPVYSYIFGAE